MADVATQLVVVLTVVALTGGAFSFLAEVFYSAVSS